MKTYQSIPLVFTLLVFALVAPAQPALTTTISDNGNFLVDSCSQFSPQFSNFIGTPPSRCSSTVQVWVANKGSAPTSGTVTLTDTFNGSGVKSITVLAISAPGWACNANLNQVVCTRSDALPPAQFYPSVTMTLLVEVSLRTG